MRFKEQVIGWLFAGAVSIILSFFAPVYCSGIVRPMLLCQSAPLELNNFTYLGILAIVIAVWIALMGDRIYNMVMKRMKKSTK